MRPGERRIRAGVRLRFVASLACVLLGASAHAIDGVIEISHERALAGGVLPNDAAGYPVEIDLPGSYRLTSDLTVPTSTNGISIETSGVRVDLNGFAIRGSFSCSTSCVPGTGSGISRIGPTTGARSAVTNGEIASFGLDGINLSGFSQVEGVVLSSIGRDAISLGGGSVALANRVFQVGESGLVFSGPTLQSVFRDNVLLDTNRGGSGVAAVEGGSATGGNVCGDGSCSRRGARRYYLTKPPAVAPTGAPSACNAGFHFASLTEISEPAGLEYDVTRGYQDSNSGTGPTSEWGWIRAATDVISNNCLLWTSTALQDDGDVMRFAPVLPLVQHNRFAWSGTALVWCIED